MEDPAKIILTSDRLILRTWTISDIPLMAAISADPVVMKYFPAIQDLATTQQLIEHFNRQYDQFGYTAYAVETKPEHQFIGFVGLNHPSFVIPHFHSAGLPIVEIGWRLTSSSWGQGYASEAARVVLQQGFTKFNLSEIIAFTTIHNHRSIRVMEKIGMHHLEKDDFNHPNISEGHRLSRHVLYRLTQGEYKKIYK